MYLIAYICYYNSLHIQYNGHCIRFNCKHLQGMLCYIAVKKKVLKCKNDNLVSDFHMNESVNLLWWWVSMMITVAWYFFIYMLRDRLTTSENDIIYESNFKVGVCCGKYINIFSRCTNRNQRDILITAVANVSKGQTDMWFKGDLQTPPKLSMRHQVCPGEPIAQPYQSHYNHAHVQGKT